MTELSSYQKGEPIHGTLQFGDELNGDETICPWCLLESRFTALSDDDGPRHMTCMAHRDAFLRWSEECTDLRASVYRILRVAVRLRDEGAPPDTAVWRDMRREARTLKGYRKERKHG